MNVDRIALRRSLPEDDAWVTAHNLYLTVYCASSVNVLCFDPVRNCDQARTYASKYCSKPEKWCQHACARAMRTSRVQSSRALRVFSFSLSYAQHGSTWNATTMVYSTGCDVELSDKPWCTTGSSSSGW